MGKILLYYKYIDIQYPKQVQKWQYRLCNELGLRGRVLIAHEGINGTVGGTIDAIEAYKEAMHNHPLFDDVDFKESDGGSEYFPRLQVVVREEIVSLHLPKQQADPQKTGTYVTPQKAHELIAQQSNDLVILDARNLYESKIGTFKNAITPNIQNFREFPQYIDEHLDQFKNKQVLMFCTGGVRCERATAYLKTKNVAKEVYQIKGGIHRYTEQYPNGFFRGKNYVFDARVAMKITDDVLSSCKICSTSCDEYTNCINAECNEQYIACIQCLKKLNNCCSQECLELVTNNKVVIRKIPTRFEDQISPCSPVKK